MATERIFTAESAGNLNVSTDHAEITIESTDEVSTVEVRVRTADDTGKSADAVNDAKIDERSGTLYVKANVGPTSGGVISSTVVMGPYAGQTSRRVTVSGPVSIIGGRIYSGDVDITDAANGSHAGQPAPSQVQVIVRMPQNRLLTVRTESGAVLAEGLYARVDAESVSGSLKIEDALDVEAETVSGSLKVFKIANTGRLSSVSGSLKVGEWQGNGRLRLKNVSGSIKVEDARQATGSIESSNVSGSTRLEGTSHLVDVRMTSVSGSRRRS